MQIVNIHTILLTTVIQKRSYEYSTVIQGFTRLSLNRLMMIGCFFVLKGNWIYDRSGPVFVESEVFQGVRLKRL